MIQKIEQIFSDTYYYDFKRMQGCDYNDPINQESKKNLTFKSHSEPNGEILL
jgi:hypothetical protein